MFCNAVISSFFQALKILASLKKGFCLHENKQAKISQFCDYAIANILPPLPPKKTLILFLKLILFRWHYWLLYLELYFVVLAAVMACERDKILLQNELRLFGTEMNIRNVVLYLHYDDMDRAGLWMYVAMLLYWNVLLKIQDCVRFSVNGLCIVTDTNQCFISKTECHRFCGR